AYLAFRKSDRDAFESRAAMEAWTADSRDDETFRLACSRRPAYRRRARERSRRDDDADGFLARVPDRRREGGALRGRRLARFPSWRSQALPDVGRRNSAIREHHFRARFPGAGGSIGDVGTRASLGDSDRGPQ